TVPVTRSPPTTVDGLSAREATATVGADTVIVVDGDAPPVTDAVIVTVPAPRAVTVKVPLAAPPGITTADGTVATVGLLLETDTVAPAAGAVTVRLTGPCAVSPTTTVARFRVMAEMATVVGVGALEEPPQETRAATARTGHSAEIHRRAAPGVLR